MIDKMKSIHKDPNRVLFPKSGNGLASSLGSHSTGGGAAASILSNKRLTLPFLVLLAALAVGVLFLLPGGLLQAQAMDSTTIEYAENGEDPVATFTATDPDDDTPITWSIAEAGDTPPAGFTLATDNADAAHFDIDADDGVLTFGIGADDDPPDFEFPKGAALTDTPSHEAQNTYRVVVEATDSTTGGPMGYHKVVVKVTNVNEGGKVTWFVDADGSATDLAANAPDIDGKPIMQFQVGATLTARVTDGDIRAEDKTVSTPAPIWRWYRSSSKTSMGTMIEDAESATYTVTTNDVGMYLRAKVTYVVTGNVDQEEASLTADYPVLQQRGGSNELAFAPASVERKVDEGKKGMNVGAPVTVKAGSNHGAVNYAFDTTGTDDRAKFEIDRKTGQITTKENLNREHTGADAAPNFGCGTDYECTVTVTATDATGDAGTNSATVTIKLEDVNEKPTFVADGTTADSPKRIRMVPENQTALFGAATDGYGTTNAEAVDVTYAATDPESQNVTWTLMGADGGKFELSSGGLLSFSEKQDYEMPTDANRDNVYEVTIRVSDGTMHEDRMVEVTVIDRDDAPVVSGPASKNFPENSKDAVATFTATDPEDDTPITWSIAADGATLPDGFTEATDNADENHFDIDDETGELTFDVGGDTDTPDASVAPDFENPKGTALAATPSHEAQNTYRVVVVATDSTTDGPMGYHKVVVKVTNVNEGGKVAWTVDPSTEAGVDANVPPAKPIMQFQVGAVLVASVTDGDIPGSTKAVAATTTGVDADPTWRWYRNGSPISGSGGVSATSTYTVTTNDVGRRIRAEATYRIGDSTTQETAPLTSDYPVLQQRGGSNELAFDPASVERKVDEGKKGMKVGAPVTVKAGSNHGAVNYAFDTTVAGSDHAKFEIDRKTGQITTKENLNREHTEADTATAFGCGTDYECTVTVTATDATGEAGTNSATVTIKLEDVNEKPTFDDDAEADSPKRIRMVPENQTALFGAATDGYGTTNAEAVDVTYAATDPEDRRVNLTLMGADGGKFRLNSGGLLSFSEKQDYEMPTDANRDNVYEVTVRASDGTMYEDRMVTVTVTDVDEAPVITSGNVAPRFATATTTREVAENTAAGQGIGDPVMATDANGDDLAYSLGGTDMASFSINSSTGQLMTMAALDYETKMSYMVTVTAMDPDRLSDSIDVTIMVTDVMDEQQSLVQRYDAISNGGDGDGELDLDEVYAAVDDYFVNGIPTLEQIYELVDLYFAQ